MELNENFEEQVRPRRHRPQIAVRFNPHAWRPIFDNVSGYAYALNIPQAGDVRPGELLQKPGLEGIVERRPSTSPSDLQARLRADGLNLFDFPIAGNGHVIAIFSNGKKERAFRQDSNGFWSYLPEGERMRCGKPFLPRQYDESQKPMKDIFKANLGDYKQFVTFASTPYAGVSYYKRLTLTNEALQPFCRATPAEIKLARHLTY